MESNRDDAERCLLFASSALAAGDLAKAIRLLEKSRRMYPLQVQQEQLFCAIQDYMSDQNQSPHPSSLGSSSSNTSNYPTPSSRPTTSQRVPSPEMKKAVAEVHKMRNKSHYEVLRLPRDCDNAAIKKTYRKLALRLHPDRNFAPGADEAFKRVGQAFVTLSDPKRREYYDRTGADEPGQPPRTGIRRRRTSGRTHPSATASSLGDFFDANELSPEELFEFLFAGASGGDPSFRRTPRQFPTNAPSLWQRLKPFVLISLFIIITLVISDNNSLATFSLNRTWYHSVRRETENHVSYFVPRDLNLSLRAQRHLERQVDFKALDQYRMLCAGERDRASYLRRQSQRWFTSKDARARYRKEYENFKQPWCHKTQQLQGNLFRRW